MTIEPTQLRAYPIPGQPPLRLEPASAQRRWMDGLHHLPQRCLPLMIANQAGWCVLNNHAFFARWDGGDEPASIKFVFPVGEPPYPVESHFGYGVITWKIPFLFRTPPGYNLLVRGPANFPKDGICALEGIVETDWAVQTFTMNWKFTRSNRFVSFSVDEPICMLVPQRRGELEAFCPELKDLAAEPDLLRQYEQFVRSRRESLAKHPWHEHRESGTAYWQRTYFRGQVPDGSNGTSEHQTRLKLRPFDGPTAEIRLTTMSRETATKFSGYSDVDGADDPRKYIRRLDQTGSTPFWQAIKHRMTTLLDISPGDWVLDVGCGTGDDARALAARVGPSGRVVGIDRSTTMVLEAAKRQEASQLAVSFCLGDASHLAFADSTFDGCRCERVLQHVDQPRQALHEMARVTRPSGWVVVVEPDYGTLSIRGADPDVTRRILACRVAHFRSGTIGRQLHGLLKGLGLIDLTVTFLMTDETNFTPGHRESLRHSFLGSAEAAGLISAAEGERWLAQLAEAGEAGQYRYAVTIFLASGRKPQVPA